MAPAVSLHITALESTGVASISGASIVIVTRIGNRGIALATGPGSDSTLSSGRVATKLQAVVGAGASSDGSGGARTISPGPCGGNTESCSVDLSARSSLSTCGAKIPVAIVDDAQVCGILRASGGSGSNIGRDVSSVSNTAPLLAIVGYGKWLGGVGASICDVASIGEANIGVVAESGIADKRAAIDTIGGDAASVSSASGSSEAAVARGVVAFVGIVAGIGRGSRAIRVKVQSTKGITPCSLGCADSVTTSSSGARIVESSADEISISVSGGLTFVSAPSSGIASKLIARFGIQGGGEVIGAGGESSGIIVVFQSGDIGHNSQRADTGNACVV